ncbi:MAG: flagellar filament capping protein FliD [Succinivibrio sp.]|nr:flagellar filament capping protein FliD [Succinivibrio sp.]
MASTTITSAGIGSGVDFESVISALVSDRKIKTVNKVATQITEKNTEISAVSSLKSFLSTFKDSVGELLKDNAFNARKVTTDQGEDNVFTVTAEDDAANMDFSLSVKQLASSEKLSKTFNKESFNNSFSAGTMTISLGKDDEGNDLGSFDVKIEDGDTLEKIRKKINKNDLGITANIVSTDEGYKFSFTSATTGKDATQLSISTTTTGTDAEKTALSVFDYETHTYASDDESSYTSDSGWTHSRGKDAVIEVDGEKITSHSNTFDQGQISGLSITVNKVSPSETTYTTLEDGTTKANTESKVYSVSVGTDSEAVTEKMQAFVTKYNLLVSQIDTLTARNTYTDGVSNDDGGDLAGDAQAIGIKQTLQRMISSDSNVSEGLTIFSAGLNFKKDGTISLDSTKFNKALSENYNSVVELFSGENSLLTKIDSYLNDFTKSAGVLDKRKDSINSSVSYLEEKQSKYTENLTNYESMLRNKYAAVDSLMTNYNTKLSYLNSVLGTTKTTKSS